MNSNKQKKKLLKAKKKQRALNNRLKSLNNDGLGRLKANHSKLAHINTYGILPNYYRAKFFTCRDCGNKEVWTARQQKFYFEECQGHIDAIAIRCKACRNLKKQAKKEQQEHMQEMSSTEPHPNELFFKNLEEFKKKQ